MSREPDMRDAVFPISGFGGGQAGTYIQMRLRASERKLGPPMMLMQIVALAWPTGTFFGWDAIDN
jgi:hypothetical protein